MRRFLRLLWVSCVVCFATTTSFAGTCTDTRYYRSCNTNYVLSDDLCIRPPTVKVTLDSKRYASTTATTGTAATRTGTTAYYYKYKTKNQCYYYTASTLDPTTCLDEISIPEMTGYKFGGYWTEKTGTGIQYVDKDGKFVGDLYSKEEENITLYAKWEAGPNTITLNANGATGGEIMTTAITSPSQTVTFECTTGSSMSLPTWSSTDSASTTSIVQSNKVFKGWAESSTGSVVSVSTCPAGGKTYYAVWESASCVAGDGVATTSLAKVENNAPVCNKSSAGGYYCEEETQTGTAGTASLTTTCSAASEGYFATAGSSSQTECAQGSYTSTPHQSACTACSPGETNSGTGNTSCSENCSNASNVTSWEKPVWNSDNTVSNLCTIDGCNPCTVTAAGPFIDGQLVSPVSECSATISNNKCTYSGTCGTGFSTTGGTNTETVASCSGSTCQCSARTYSVPFGCGVGTGTAPSTQTATYGSNFTMPTNTCTAPTGYHFNGWVKKHHSGIIEPGDVIFDFPVEAGTSFQWTYYNWVESDPLIPLSLAEYDYYEAVYEPNCNAITLNANGGTAGSVTKLYKKTDATGWYSDSACSTSWTSGTNVKPSRSGYTFRGFYSTDLDDVSSDSGDDYANKDKQYITATGTSSPNGTNWTVNGATTIYAAWAKDCPSSVSHGSCSLLVSTAGVVDYTTSCNTGYTLSGDGTATPNCGANEYDVTYKCGSNTSGSAPLDDKATYGQSFTPAENTCTKPGYTFAGWDDGRKVWTEADTWTYTQNKTFTASWTPNCNAITLDNETNGGSENTTLYKLTDSTAWYSDDKCSAIIIQITKPTKANATYAGHYSSTTSSTSYITNQGNLITTWAVNSPQTIYAQYDCNSNYTRNGTRTGQTCDNSIYTITLNDGDGAGGSGNINEVYNSKWTDNEGNEITLVTIPTLTNSVFTGYYTSAKDGTQKIPATGTLPVATTFTDNTTLYAHFDECTKCAAVKGATCSLSVQNNECKYTTSCTSGYQNITNNEKYNPACSPIESTVTLKNDTVTVNTVKAKYDSAMPAKDTNGKALTMPMADKQVFLGYYDATSGGTQYYTSALASAHEWDKEGSQTLNAQFADCTCETVTGVTKCTAESVTDNKCTYDVTYENGYYGRATQTNNTAGQASYTPTAEQCTNRPKSNAEYINSALSNACPWQCKEGYSTTGSKNGIAQGTQSGKTCSAITDYSITYNMGGGTNYNGAPIIYTYGSGATINGTPTKTGYTFAGWTGSNGATAETEVTISKTDTGDKEYTAHWTANQYEVTYTAGTGGTGSDRTQTVIYNEMFTTKTSDTFSKANATFVSWDSSNGRYPNANTQYTYTTADDVTLTAIWRCEPNYNLNADGNCELGCNENISCSDSFGAGWNGTYSGCANNENTLCWRYCTTYDITGAATINDKRVSYNANGGDKSDCAATSCKEGYYLDGGICQPAPQGYTCPEGSTSVNECYMEIERLCRDPGANKECPESPIGAGACEYEDKVTVTCIKYFNNEDCNQLDIPKCPYTPNQTTCATTGYVVYENSCQLCEDIVGEPWTRSYGGWGRESCFNDCDYECGPASESPDCPNNATCINISETITGQQYWNQEGTTVCTPPPSSCSVTWGCNPGYKRNSRGTACIVNTFTITLDDDGGAGGSGAIYQKYTLGWYADKNATSSITSINIPTRENWTFLGYGPVDSDDVTFAYNGGETFDLPNDYTLFTADTMLKAKWRQNVIACESGKYYDGSSMQDCQSGWYCPGKNYQSSVDGVQQGTTLIGSAGCYVTCPEDVKNGTVSSPNGATSVSACETVRSGVEVTNGHGSGNETCNYNQAEHAYAAGCTIAIKSCEAGYWRNAEDATVCSDTQSGKYSPENDVNEYSCADLPGGENATSAMNSANATDCYNTCSYTDEPIANGVRNPESSKVFYTDSGFSACTYVTSCATGYKVTADSLACEPKIIPLTINPNNDSATAPYTIYLKYNTGWYSDANATTLITQVEKPAYTAHTFGGYYYNENTLIADSDGNLVQKKFDVINGSEENPIALANWSENPKISCDEGYYYKGTGNQCTTCPKGSYCPGVQGVPQDTAEAGKFNCVDLNGSYEPIGVVPFTNEVTSAEGSVSKEACYAVNVKFTSTNGYGYYNKCFYNANSNTYDANCGDNGFAIINCNAGNYWKNTTDTDCSPVGVSYYSKPGDTTRTQCPNADKGATTGSETAGQIEECYLGDIWYENAHSGQRRKCYHTKQKDDGTINTDISAYQYNCESGQIMTCAAGYYDDGQTTIINASGKPERDCVPVGQDFYSPSQSYFTDEPEKPTSDWTIHAGQKASSIYRYECPNDGITGSVTTAELPTECYKVCDASDYSTDGIESITVVSDKAYYDAESGYVCKYNVVCADGYSVQNNNGPAPTCVEQTCKPGHYWTGKYVSGNKECKQCAKGTAGNGSDIGESCTPCADGYYADQPGMSTCTQCPAGNPDGEIHSDYDRSESKQCYEVLKGQTTMNNDSLNGTGTTTCHLYEDTSYTAPCSVVIDSCEGGYYLATKTDTSCSKVGIGYYSKNGELARQECPDPENSTTEHQDSDSPEQCYKTCGQQTYTHGYRKVDAGNENVFYNSSTQKYPACEYKTYCDDGYASTSSDPYCVEGIFKITLDSDGGTGGTSHIYEKYNTGWYSDAGATNEITSITLPTKANKTFVGYYTTDDSDYPIIDENAAITVNAERFIRDTELIARWRTTPIMCQSGEYYDGSDTKECPSGWYCPGSNYEGNIDDVAVTGYTASGIQGCYNECPVDSLGGKVSSELGSNDIKGCQTTRDITLDHGTGYKLCEYDNGGYSNCEQYVTKCDAGYYYDSDKNDCVKVPQGSYSEADEIISHLCSELPGADDTVTTSSQGATSATECYNVCPVTDAMFTNPLTKVSAKVGTYSPTDPQPHYNTEASGIPTCQYVEPNCDSGFENTGNNTCTSKIVKITLNHNDGTQQSDTQPLSNNIYLQYSVAWYDTDALKNVITSVNTPKIPAQAFGGYVSSDGTIIIAANGQLPHDTTKFTNDTTLTAMFTPKASVSCESGTYYNGFGNATEGCKPCPEGAWCPGADTFVDIETEVGKNACETNASYYTAATANNGTSLTVEIKSDGKRSEHSDCYATNVQYVTTNGAGSQSCHYSNGKYNDNCWDKTLLRCDAGYYQNSDDATKCVVAPNGSYSETDELELHLCSALSGADGTVTTKEDGAASATECYNVCPDKDVTFDNPTTGQTVVVGYREPLVRNPAYSTDDNQIPACTYTSATCTNQCFGIVADTTTCEPKVLTVTLNHMSGVAQSDAEPLSDNIYLQCSVGWFADETLTTTISSVNTPKSPGQAFGGYVSGLSTVVDSQGRLTDNYAIFTSNAEASAQYTPKQIVTCPAGKYYVGFGDSDSGCATCPAGSWCPGITETDIVRQDIEVAKGINACSTNAADYTPAAEIVDEKGQTQTPMTVTISSKDGSESSGDCYAQNVKYSTQYGNGYQTCYYGKDGKYTTECKDKNLLRCIAGYYREKDTDIDCVIVDEQSYSAEGELTKHQCPETEYQKGKFAIGTITAEVREKITQCAIDGVQSEIEHGVVQRDCHYNITSHLYDDQCTVETTRVIYCDAGYWDDGVIRETRKCVPVEGLAYSPEGDTTKTDCPENSTGIDDEHSLQTQCYTTCNASDYTTEHIANISVIDEHPHYSTETGYVCKYDAECDRGYYVADNLSSAPYCVANLFDITLNNDNADFAGTTTIYEQFNIAIYLNDTDVMTTNTNPIVLPEKAGYVFAGYYTIPNGQGIEMISSNGYITSDFATDYFTDNDQLYAKWSTCTVPNAQSYNIAWGACAVESCVFGFHPTSDHTACESDIIDCVDESTTSDTHIKTATKQWNGTQYGICTVQECLAGYHIESNTCVPNTKTFDIENGKCTRTWDGVFKRWNDDCTDIICNVGFAPNDSPYATDPNKPCSACDNSYSAEGELAVATWKSGICQIDKCLFEGQKYVKEGNMCRLICTSDSDDTGTIRWNSVTNQCELTCEPGYIQW